MFQLTSSQLAKPYNDNSWRAKLLKSLVPLSMPLYRGIFKRHKQPWNLRIDSLSSYPCGTLGAALYHFLIRNDCSLMPKFESHDIFHILLDYSTTAIEESRLQFCLLGNGKRSVYCLMACTGSILVYPEYIVDFYSHFRRGHRLNAFHQWSFQQHLKTPLDQLQRAMHS